MLISWWGKVDCKEDAGVTLGGSANPRADEQHASCFHSLIRGDVSYANAVPLQWCRLCAACFGPVRRGTNWQF